MNTVSIVLPDDCGLPPVGPRLCVYCHQSVGHPHGADCVVVRRVIRGTLVLQVWGELCIVRDFIDLMPASWGESQILFRYNEGSSCLDNVLSWIALLTGDKLIGRLVEELNREESCSCSMGHVRLETNWSTKEIVPQNLSREAWLERYLHPQDYSS